MNVVRHSVDRDKDPFVVANDPGKISIEFDLQNRRDERKTVFRCEDEMVQEMLYATFRVTRVSHANGFGLHVFYTFRRSGSTCS